LKIDTKKVCIFLIRSSFFSLSIYFPGAVFILLIRSSFSWFSQPGSLDRNRSRKPNLVPRDLCAYYALDSIHYIWDYTSLQDTNRST